MKLILSLLLFSYLNPAVSWNTDFEKAKAEALRSHRLVILNFSGSDWCGPCIRMKKEIFESNIFEKYAEQNLVLVNADFPRLKKNELSKEQTKGNESLADKYNAEGKFPFTILFDGEGNILKRWEGYPDESSQKFVNEINEFVHAAN